MAAIPGSDRRTELETWLAPFLDRLRRKEQRRWAPPVYLQGLLGPGERKSVEPMAGRVAPGDVQQPHHFVAASPWATGPLEAELVRRADRLVGGPEAVPVIDDTGAGQAGQALGRRRPPVLRRAGQAGRLPGPGLAHPGPRRGAGRRRPAPVPAGGLGGGRRAPGQGRRAGGHPHPRPAQVARLALDELDRVRAAGATFGGVLADAEYGKAAEFRHGLAERGLCAGRSASRRRRRSTRPT